ncbi:MAG: bifunctional folylpolyglutamate synthase/dihydrofolate synthase [Oligosphaeraceae bacterium]
MLQDFDPQRENAFFQLFREFYDLEKSVVRQHDPANYTLDRLRPLAELAGHPEEGLKLVHVAGTKGKGTTSFYTAALITAAGHRCGVFSSPHLDTVRERFQVDGQLADLEELEELAIPLCRKVRQANLKPSLFELFTVLALQYFQKKGVDYAVLETGIGGRVDSTNYPRRKELAIITPLSYDHTALLGSDIRQIAAEKAGILRENTPVLLGRQPYAAGEEVVLAEAARLHAPVHRPGEDAPASTWLPPATPPFLQENFQCAWTAVELLGMVPQRSLFRPPRLRARFECIRENPPVILDAAHNGDSARRLREALTTLYPRTHFLCILGSVPGKDVAGIVEGLKGLDAEYILTNPQTPRGSALPQLVQAAREAGLVIREVIPALERADQLPDNLPLLFTGSFFTALIGEQLFHAPRNTP